MSARNRREGDPDFLEWQRSYQAEQDAAKAAADAAQAAVEAADPVLAFQKASNAEAQAIRELILTGYVPESILPVERIGGRRIVESAKISNFKWFADNTQTFERWMAGQLIDVAFRSDIAPVAANYLALHNLMLSFSAYIEPVEQPAVTEPEVVEPVLSRSEQMVIAHHAYVNDVVGVDEAGREWREVELDQLPAKDALRLRRLFEKGHRGSSLLDTYHEIKDIQQARDVEIARRGAEEAQQ